ncbi:MAG: ATP-binding protein, partial [Candidatus Dadabacteria bacterium]
MLYKRDLEKHVERMASYFPAILITGARQSGKTTLLRQLYPQYSYVSLDMPSNAAKAENEPASFLAEHTPPVVIDEVQYAPKIFRHLKVAIDRTRECNGRFFLTGSQKFTLMREVSESLAGRCGILHLENLSMHELSQSPLAVSDHGAILARGFFPQLWRDQRIDPEDFYSAYIATYIERDVRQLLRISSLRDFERFIRACAARSGQLLNKSEIARDVGITPTTVNEWLSVLEASNQITLLEPYFGNISKRLVKSPKLYINDSGLLCFLLGLSPSSLTNSYYAGAVWESFILSELRKILQSFPHASLWFYRDKQREVDFLIDIEGQLH